MLTLLCLFTALNVLADVTLPSVFSNNMVLQQKTNAAIWGKAHPNATVKIFTSWNKKSYVAKANAAGDWKVKVATPSYGGPYSITITGQNKIVLNNVLIGEVWLCSGQSNMEMPLAGWGKVVNYEAEIAGANYPKIRLLQAIHTASNRPLYDLKVRNQGWDVCTPATIGEFSSTAYFFAREIYNRTKIPVGLIHSSWGGTIAEAWTSYETLKTLPDFAKAAKQIKDAEDDGEEAYEEKLRNWLNALDANDPGYKNSWESASFNDAGWASMKLPEHWDAVVLKDYDGVVWFRKAITLPESWKGQNTTLNLGAIDDDDITWFNGVKVGSTEGYAADRKYEIPAAALRAGENIITVRVFDGAGAGGLYGEAEKMYIQNSKGDRISLAGDWRYKPSVNLRDVSAKPASPNTPNRPSVLYNGMINPIINYAIRGAIWYQGEGNAWRAYQYRTLLPAMIKDWRTKFSSGDFPFYIVQLANFMKVEPDPGPSAWAELREAQLMTALNIKNSGLANAIDIGDAADIHPKNKQEVGRRLALIALNKVYGRKNEYSGPLYKSFKKEGNTIRLNFDHAKGLHAKGDRVLGFAIAGADKKFYWAEAKITGNTIIVSGKDVPNPVAVRYGWANNPDVNVYNDSHLPAVPFRTDDWQESTYNNK